MGQQEGGKWGLGEIVKERRDRAKDHNKFLTKLHLRQGIQFTDEGVINPFVYRD
jgi:hypothetical protein